MGFTAKAKKNEHKEHEPLQTERYSVGTQPNKNSPSLSLAWLYLHIKRGIARAVTGIDGVHFLWPAVS